MSIQQQYNEWHSATADFWEDPLNFQWYQTTNRLLPNLDNLDVLEIGCGRGNFSQLVKKKNPAVRLTAVDISEVAIEAARKAPNGIRFQVADAENLAFPDASFDFIFSCETMEHLPHPERLPMEIFRLLRPGGKFIITTENYFNGMTMVWLKTWLKKEPFDSGSGAQPHENYFLFFRVASMIRKSGLKLTHTESNHFQWLMLPGVNPAKLCTQDFASPFLKKFFKPFGRHYTYSGSKPV
ncbi:class I SAM-dependent methyltransferase [Puia sp.]|jgi:ubiquinone/menaquinone biosynthesis C-methylase UbiE|uniref:class I SAM-dependent methyltransferase n=1 Tax=Puia sp. TaxID=2045100 RepID=UPI002F3E2C78